MVGIRKNRGVPLCCGDMRDANGWVNCGNWALWRRKEQGGVLLDGHGVVPLEEYRLALVLPFETVLDSLER